MNTIDFPETAWAEMWPTPIWPALTDEDIEKMRQEYEQNECDSCQSDDKDCEDMG